MFEVILLALMARGGANKIVISSGRLNTRLSWMDRPGEWAQLFVANGSRIKLKAKDRVDGQSSIHTSRQAFASHKHGIEHVPTLRTATLLLSLHHWWRLAVTAIQVPFHHQSWAFHVFGIFLFPLLLPFPSPFPQECCYYCARGPSALGH